MTRRCGPLENAPRAAGHGLRTADGDVTDAGSVERLLVAALTGAEEAVEERLEAAVGVQRTDDVARVGADVWTDVTDNSQRPYLGGVSEVRSRSLQAGGGGPAATAFRKDKFIKVSL